MSWRHVSSSGAQVASSGQSTLSATFPGAIAAGDLIVVSVTYWYSAPAPTVQDSVNSTGYTYIGQTPANNSGQIGTWYYVAASGGSNFEVTVTSNGTQYLAMTIDAYSFTPGDVVSIDSDGYATGSSATPTLSSALSITASDLVYATCTLDAPSETISAGSGLRCGTPQEISMGKAMESQPKITSTNQATLHLALDSRLAVDGASMRSRSKRYHKASR